jgi:hypothetical protein
MKTISISNVNLFPTCPPLIHKETRLERCAIKTQSLWTQFLQWMGQFIRDAVFMPISDRLPQAIKSDLKREEEFFRAFWDPKKPLDPNYPHQEEMRKEFNVYDQPIKMHTADGTPLEITCRIIESKKRDEKLYNFVHVLGNLATISNNIAAPYPFIAAYLDHQKSDPSLPPGRFILVSQYGMVSDGVPFKPRSLDEAGLILKKAVETLSETHGQIDYLAAMSLGSIIFASSLKHFENSAAFPRHIHFDRAPSSIKASSKNYYGGTLLYLLAKATGWSADIGQELSNFYREKPKIPCIVSGVREDFFFPGSASLHEDKNVKGINQIKRLIFSPPQQLFHARAHHGLRADFLNFNYLVGDSNRELLKERENLANAALRHSFQVLKLPQPLSA